MDITTYISQGREKALLYGDYSTYHSQLVKRLLGSRRKLAIITKSRGKFQKKDEVTAENIAEDHEYVHLLLLTSERAWAQAMSFKSNHTNARKGIVGRTRSHIISRLNKAARSAQHLAEILSDSASGAENKDILEAKAYAALIRGAMYFEKQAWEPCLRSYSTARVIYSALATTGNSDLFKDLLTDTIDPSIRYAAYQLNTPRTIPIPAIARKFFPQSDATLVKQINAVDPNALSGDADSETGAEEVPKTLTWRSRQVKIEDARIAQAWAEVKSAQKQLSETLSKQADRSSHQIAAAYDGILTATQNAVDSTKDAIDELRGEGVNQSDPRMQSLQITRTAVNYEMISWRIGRNRVLTGASDGAVEDYSPRKTQKKADNEQEQAQKSTEASNSRKLSKLKEKVALYDGTLQNIDSVRELPGVAADEGLSAKLDAYAGYFQALKALSIARSHSIAGNVANALALINHSFAQCKAASQLSEDEATKGPLNLEVSTASIASLSKLVNGELQRHRAIVHIDHLRAAEQKEASSGIETTPLVERLHEYPVGDVDLENVVQLPPKKSLIPMKPIFLDVAWNYITYSGKKTTAASAPASGGAAAAAAESDEAEEPAQQKRGWFGFGR
ncbi:hypothetical protein Golomagni_06107 [Golovinomyces magnicellulatus]|nr:hypothetical protein Golomagni_06107 [Golovinomyces magnicellulatus]